MPSRHRLRSKSIAYFCLIPATGSYFKCQKYNVTLSTDACAKRYLASQGNKKYQHCVRCPIGADHTGVMASKPISHRQHVSFICSRCHQSTWRAAVKNRNLCVTCWNREREVKIGRNRKGRPPVVKDRFWEIDTPEKPDRCAKIFSISIVVSGNHVSKKAVDTVEVLLETVREPGFCISRSTQRVLPRLKSILPLV